MLFHGSISDTASQYTLGMAQIILDMEYFELLIAHTNFFIKLYLPLNIGAFKKKIVNFFFFFFFFF